MSKHEHDFPESGWPFEAAINTASITTTKVAHYSFPVLLAVHDHDGDWQLLCGTTNNIEDSLLDCLGCVYARDATLGEIADLAPGWYAERAHAGGPWQLARIPADDE